MIYSAFAIREMQWSDGDIGITIYGEFISQDRTCRKILQKFHFFCGRRYDDLSIEKEKRKADIVKGIVYDPKIALLYIKCENIKIKELAQWKLDNVNIPIVKY